MYENLDENRQIHAKGLLFFKITPMYCLQNTPFCWFREFAPTFENLPLFSRKWYERGIRFDREWGGVECGVGCGLWGVGVGVRWVWVWGLGVRGWGVGGWGWGGWGVFPGIWILIIKIRQSCDRLIFIRVISIRVRQYLYIKIPPPHTAGFLV